MFDPTAEVQAFRLRLARRRGAAEEISPWLNILAWEEDDTYFAHCLELDIVAEGTSEEGARTSLGELIIAQTDFAEKHKTEIFHPAPEPYWEKLRQIHANHVRQRLLDSPPRSVHELLKGFELVHA